MMKRTERLMALLLALALTLTALPGYALAVETGETAEETVSEETVSEETAETETAAEEPAGEEPTETEAAAEAVAVEEAAAEETTIGDSTATVAASYSGKCGANVTWTLSSDGATLTISGSGATYAYSDFSTPWWEVQVGSMGAMGDIKTVVIKSGVTSLGKLIFAHLHGVTSVTIANTVTNIGDGAFYDCGSIKTLTIPDSVTTIGDSAFSCNDALTKVTIPSSVTSIGKWAFYGCYNLTSVTIPATVTYIGSYAFGYTYEGYFDDPGDDYLMSNFVIYGYTGSAAETYAKNNGITFVSLGNAVGVPTMSSITNVSNGVKITWSAVSGATKYNIYRKVSGSTSWTKVGSSTTTSYTSTGVTSGKTYTFTVQAVSSAGSGNYGSSTKTIRYLSMPSLTVSNVVGGIKLSWTKSTGASGGYYVYRKTEGGSYSRIACVATGTLTYTDTTASAGVKYYYAVRAASNGYLSAYSAKSITRLSTPSGITVINTANGVRVTWGTVKGATSYEVYRKPVGGSWTKVGTSTTTNYTSTGVESGKTYTFTVRAVYNTTKSAYNTTGKTIRFLSEPTITLSNTSSGVKVSWTKSTGATDGYYVYRRTASGSYTLIAKVASGTLSYTDKAASAGVKYYYAVRARSNGYASSYTSKFIVRLGHPTLTLTSASTGVKLSWTKVTGCTGYCIYRKTGSGSYTKLMTVSGSGSVTWTDTTAKKGTTYTYYVQAYQGSSVSSYTAKTISY